MARWTIDHHLKIPEPCRGGVVSVGNFDGVHRGHAALFQVNREIAAKTGGPVVALTFDPHPLAILTPERYQLPLTTMEERAIRLAGLGVDEVIVLQTTRELLALTPEAFFSRLLCEQLACRGIVEGFNFRFGHDRVGSNELLRSLCNESNVVFREVEPYLRNDRPVSSSRVRDALSLGDIQEATALLARPYRVRGIVGVGAQRGRTIGFPTANLENIETLLPVEGVYAVSVEFGGRTWAGAANLGPNPTFQDSRRKFEIHLIDFAGDLYGQYLNIDFLARLRDTLPFASVSELQSQLAKDISDARNRFEIAR